MKKASFKLLIFTLVILSTATGCKVKRDCRGHIKHKLPNGIWM